MPPDASAPATAVDPATAELMAFLADATGNARLSSPQSPVPGEIRARLAKTGAPSVTAYLNLLRSGAEGRREFDALVARLTVGETFFFRQPEHFSALRDVVVPALLARNAGTRQLRIWSAGCASGAEPYSIAILLHGMLGENLSGWDVTIVGSDINAVVLEEASRAVYSPWALRGVSGATLPAFFTKAGEGWRLRDRYRKHVRFVAHNLVRDAIPSFAAGIRAFDLIFCRNVILYFDDASQGIAAAALDRSLVDGGYLFVAPTDTNHHLVAAFSAESIGAATVYRKGAVPRKVVAAERRPARRVPRHVRPAPPRLVRVDRGPAVSTAASDGVLAHADRGELATAARLADAAVAAHPMDPAAHFARAVVMSATSRTGDAEASFRRAIYLDRGFALAHYHLALLRAAHGDLIAARRGFANVVDLLTGLDDRTPLSGGSEIDAGALRSLAKQRLVGESN